MKLLATITLAILACFAGPSAAKGLECTLKPAEVPNAWIDMVDPCIRALKSQIQVEIQAALTYLAMGAHFARDTVNRPGFSELFFENAKEERQHAITMIEYLLMRGQLVNDASKLLNLPVTPVQEEWKDGLEALKHALDLETSVTKKIQDIIMTCETPKDSSFNDYHLVDYLTGEFLDEQYKGERKLAGLISTLGKTMTMHDHLGEFLFDKKLLKNEL